MPRRWDKRWVVRVNGGHAIDAHDFASDDSSQRRSLLTNGTLVRRQSPFPLFAPVSPMREFGPAFVLRSRFLTVSRLKEETLQNG